MFLIFNFSCTELDSVRTNLQINVVEFESQNAILVNHLLTTKTDLKYGVHPRLRHDSPDDCFNVVHSHFLEKNI
jgi:hypothetical protein